MSESSSASPRLTRFLSRFDRLYVATAGGGDKGYSAVATIVMRSYYSRKSLTSYSRLRKAIQRYFSGVGEAASDPLLDLVATAWETHFEIRLTRDRKAAVAKDCAGF